MSQPFYTEQERLAKGIHQAVNGTVFEYLIGVDNRIIRYSNARAISQESFAQDVADVVSHIHLWNVPRLNGFAGWGAISFVQIKPFEVVCSYSRVNLGGPYGMVPYYKYFDTKQEAKEFLKSEQKEKKWDSIAINELTEFGHARINLHNKTINQNGK